ncbi:MAG: hypothetical protein IID45_10890 [Planctomycetes bacterium]|nr:hypothetical protein [Planctomycetota bacterium]
MLAKSPSQQQDEGNDFYEDLSLGVRRSRKQRFLEIFLVLVIVLLALVMHKTIGYNLVVLNLFFLPIILAGFFLGRYRAGILALLAVLSAAAVVTVTAGNDLTVSSPIIVGLAVLVWGAVLGLTAIIVGTLSDERIAKLIELHEAHIGVVDVLTRYLQSADPKLNARANRVANLCRKVAKQLKLSSTEIDNIRVAALLQDLENIEITARVIRKAVVHVEGDPIDSQAATFHGSDLVESLGQVLTGAFPLISMAEEIGLGESQSMQDPSAAPPLMSARILMTVRAYDVLEHGHPSGEIQSADDVIEEMRSDGITQFDPIVLNALGNTVCRQGDRPEISKSGTDTRKLVAALTAEEPADLTLTGN